MDSLNYDKFKAALGLLEQRYKNFSEIKDSEENFPPFIIESVKESCIQRFEVCFDTAWKHLKKYLKEDLGVSNVPESPKPLFKLAAKSGAIDDAELWLEFNQKRINTSHDYYANKADETFAIIPDFIAESIDLYQTMSEETWRQ